MELTIYDQTGKIRKTVSPDSSSQWIQEVCVENTVTVNFTIREFFVLSVGDYIQVDGQRFRIKKEYRPKQASGQKYTYNVRFCGREHDAEDLLFCRMSQGEDDLESVFAYDGTPMDYLQKVVQNLNRNTDGVVWKAGSAIAGDRKAVKFNGLYCRDALNEIAQAFETEWWVDGEYLNLCRCEHGERVTLGYLQGLKTGLTQQENTNAVKWFTRLIPIGSTRNIDPSDYGYARLQLPSRDKYIDLNTQLGLKEHREENAFSGIYPHRIGTVSAVRSEEKTDKEGGKYTVYYVKDSDLPFNPEEQMLPGLVIHMTFHSGYLAGKDFECNWLADTQEFEIINTYPDENTQLPGGNLIPAIGNNYILWNIRMPDSYTAAAEREYENAVNNFLDEYARDISIYTADTDYIYVDSNRVPLSPGQRVRLMSEEYFGQNGGYRDSRMTRVVRKLDNLSEATISCSGAVSNSWKSGVESSINNMEYTIAQEILKNIIRLLRTGDTEEPGEYTAFSSRRSMNEHISKKGPDTAAGLITFLKGIMIGKKGHGVTLGGNNVVTAILDELKNVFRIVSPDFVSGDLGAGFILKYDKNTGRSYLEVDELLVRKLAYFVELVIKRLSYVGGEIILTPASMKCSKVEVRDTCYRCYFEQNDSDRSIVQEFRTGDQARCQTFNIKEGTSHGVSNTYYWRLVTATGTDYIDLSKDDCDAGSTAPSAGDHIVQLGNRDDSTRQNAIILSTIGDDAPSIKQYKGIDSYSLTGKEVTILSPSLNKFMGKFISAATGKEYDEIFNNLQVDMDLIKEQADKEYTIWFYEHVPGPDNLPASEWTTPELKTLHDQDLFYNRATGLAYRYEGGSWLDVTDQFTIKALENAAKAQDTADGKRRVFVSQPTTDSVYDVGDLWVNATYGDYKNDALVCVTAKKKGMSFSISHWQPSSTATTAVIQNLGDRILQVVGDLEDTDAAVEAAKDLANQGINDAYDAYLKALEALGLAGDANDAASDNYTVIQQTKNSITALANKISFDSNGNISNINTSGLVTTADFNTLLSKKVTLDSNGNVTNINKSGLVTSAEFARLFSEQAAADGLVKRAEISTFITEDDAGRIISNATIQADQIRFNGNIIANDAFMVDKQGNVTMNNATVNGGFIGDVTINGRMETNADSGYKIIIDPATSSIEFQASSTSGRDYPYVNIGFGPLGGNDNGYICLMTRDSSGNLVYTTEMYGAYVKTRDSDTGRATEIDANHGLTLWGGSNYAGFTIGVNDAGYYQIYNRFWPRSSADVEVGGAYLDGNTLKVRTS